MKWLIFISMFDSVRVFLLSCHKLVLEGLSAWSGMLDLLIIPLHPAGRQFWDSPSVITDKVRLMLDSSICSSKFVKMELCWAAITGICWHIIPKDNTANISILYSETDKSCHWPSGAQWISAKNQTLLLTVKNKTWYRIFFLFGKQKHWLVNQELLCLVCFGLYLLSFFSPLLNPRLLPTSSSPPLWLSAVTTCCANWKRPWLVLSPKHSGWCPVVFLSAGGWQLAFQLRCSAVWTLASPCRPLTSLPLQTQGQVQSHAEQAETADLHLFLLQCGSKGKHVLHWWELFQNKWNQRSRD